MKQFLFWPKAAVDDERFLPEAEGKAAEAGHTKSREQTLPLKRFPLAMH